MLQIYTGQGKGKTTAALGLALRAVGAGKKVLLIQFLKDGQSSELKAIRRIAKREIKIKVFGKKGFINKDDLSKQDFDLAEKGFAFFQKAVRSGKYNLIILDEVNVAVSLGLLKKEDFISFIKKVSGRIEIILTGRQADPGIVRLADLVTEMKEIKHYFNKGLKARKGIEY
jgi:cob(I)alamin adenosyltransferase